VSDGGPLVERLDGLVAGMGHDLRTPLNLIIGFTDLLLMELPGPLNEAQRRQLTDIRSAGRAMLGMTDNLVELARLERGAVEVEVEESALAPLLDDVRSSFQAMAGEHGLSIVVEPSGADRCHTDPRVLARILGHLVANGLAYTEAGGVTLRAHDAETPGAVRIDVVDSGIGISEHDRTMLFQPFDRAAGDAGSGRHGIGLGLLISRRLADLIGAEITVETEVGRGTTCSVTLPGKAER
jgi:two-component system sensor histidine kinase/response regulator